jgi:arsenate reductase-like glutaredoxin family protein
VNHLPGAVSCGESRFQRTRIRRTRSQRRVADIIGDDPIEPFLNTRTPLYREKNMKQKPPSKDEAIKLMLKDPNLLKRPVIIKGKKKLTGFNEAEVRALL